MTWGRFAWWATIAAIVVAAAPCEAAASGIVAPHLETLTLRGRTQNLHVYGERKAPVAIVSSGDGGWVHLGPAVAGFLASEGYFVVGFDAKAYLSGFTTSSETLTVEDVPRDYAALVDYAAQGAAGPPLLVGVSEGAGLSLLAATAPDVQARVQGVVALGLPEKNELGWRWRDSIIYITKKTPNEPTFSAREVANRVAPVPLAAIHSTHDEFVPVSEVREILARARQPKRLWVVESKDHRFSDSQPELQRILKEAISWTESASTTAR
jgi:type IV secretory pathway VirJ component